MITMFKVGELGSKDIIELLTINRKIKSHMGRLEKFLEIPVNHSSTINELTELGDYLMSVNKAIEVKLDLVTAPIMCGGDVFKMNLN